MTLDELVRTARRAALTAAVLGVPADLFHFTITTRADASQSLAFRLHGIGLVTAFTCALVALAAVVLAQQGRAGRLGRVGALIALVGTALVLGDIAKEAFGLPLAPAVLDDPQGYYLAVVIGSFAALSLGWLLTAVAARRAGVATGRAAGLLAVGAVVALPPMPGSYVLLLLGILVVVRGLPVPAAAAPTATDRRDLVAAHAG